MITISSIKTHMFCPMKLYLQTHVDNTQKNDIQLNLELKKIKIDTQDLIQKNMRKLKKDMGLVEVEEILSENIGTYLESTFSSIESMNLGLTTEQIVEINNQSRPWNFWEKTDMQLWICFSRTACTHTTLRTPDLKSADCATR